ncbi:MAG TPA: DUF488 domain-containing protein [Micropepsaceae bacterium]|nr:DUF488 domain-containing protein [Micropepsaceae bacterium]
MIFTIGHSNHTSARFLDLLRAHGITALADVRSAPHSRWASQFNKEALAAALAENGIAYVYLGKELGGRPKDPTLLNADKPDYAAIAQTDLFRAGIARLLEGAKTYRVAVMCAERDPVECHRFRLIARHLATRDVPVTHILADGKMETQAETESRFTALKGGKDLFE